MARPIGDTGRQRITPTAGDGEHTADGLVAPVTGLEQKPCMVCRSFEKDEPKLVQFFRAKKMDIGPTGDFTTPIAKEAGYKSLQLNVKDFGWCRFLACPTDMLATCEKWSLRREMAGLYGR
jgi:hypothetical protein